MHNIHNFIKKLSNGRVFILFINFVKNNFYLQSMLLSELKKGIKLNQNKKTLHYY